MPRNLRRDELDRRTRARRQHALDRQELTKPTTPRAAPASPTSHAVKVVDEETRRLIDEALVKKGMAP